MIPTEARASYLARYFTGEAASRSEVGEGAAAVCSLFLPSFRLLFFVSSRAEAAGVEGPRTFSRLTPNSDRPVCTQRAPSREIPVRGKQGVGLLELDRVHQ
jgi:hypothetical protein